MERLELLAEIDEIRREGGFLSIAETLALRADGNIVYDPFSTLISRHARLGAGNVFFPTTMIRCSEGSRCEIGDRNIFHPMATVDASAGGTILIGGGNSFGDGGFTARADRSSARIVIGDRGRYASGASIFGVSELGTGSQILGQISVVDCTLGAGEDFTHSDPDLRGALLKGYGAARKLRLEAGEVISGKSGFEQSAIQRQTDFHPKPPAA
jgi:acetyltransferase-like isoleucine patch superfamily enzyme